MAHSNSENKNINPIPIFDLLHTFVCLVVIGYYLLKFSSSTTLPREGEVALDALFIVIIAIKFFKTLNKSKLCSGEKQ